MIQPPVSGSPSTEISRSAAPFPFLRRHGLAVFLLLLGAGTASADLVTLLGSDAAGTTSFTGATNWSNGQAPSAANDYFVPKSLINSNVDYIIRTPSSGAVTFAGNSLTIEGYVAFKGTNLVTVNDLRLTNGLVGNYSTGGTPPIGRLAGHLNVITNGVLYAGGGNLQMQIFSIITGSGNLEIRQPSIMTLSAVNTYNGPVVVNGSTLVIDSAAAFTPSSLTLQPFINGGSSWPNVTNIVRAGGSLSVGNGPDSVLRLGYRSNSSTNCNAIFNLSAQSEFTANVGEFSVGINANSSGSHLSVATVTLATNNSIIATNILIADGNGASGGSSSVTLGSGNNYFNTPSITLGKRKEGAQLTLPAGGVFQLDNNGDRADFGISVQDLNTSANPSSTANFGSGTFVASLDNLIIGEKTLGGAGSDSGTLIISSNADNYINANTVVIGNMQGVSSGTPVTQGTLTFGGGSFTVNNDVTLSGFDNSGGSVSSTLNINGGTFSVAGNVMDGGGFSTLNVNGVLDLQPAGDATPGSVTVDVLTGNGVITNASSVAISTLISPGATNAAGTLTVSSLDLSSGAPLVFDLDGDLTIGGGVNDFLQVNGDLTFNGNTLTITTLSPLSTGTYHLINYTGALNGNTSLTLNAPTTRQSYNLDLSTPGQVNLVVTGNPIGLLWSGDGSGNIWDVGSSANWNGGTDVYYDGDYATFNDTGSASPNIYVAQTVQPGSLTVNNSAEVYEFDGSPIQSPGNLLKQGGNLLTFANDGNSFGGGIDIEGGAASVGNGGSTGSLTGSSITNNGELVLNKSSGGAAFNMPISGSGSLRLTGGGGSLAVSGTNTYMGLTTIGNGSQLNINNNFALGSTNVGTVVQSGGSVRFTTVGNWSVAEPLEINGYGLPDSAGALYANGGNNIAVWSGPIIVASPAQIRVVNSNVKMTLTAPVTANNQTLQASANDSSDLLTFQNTLSLGTDPTLATLTTGGSGIVALAGVTNIAGSTTVNGGTLEIVTTNTPQIGDVVVNSGALQIGSGAGDGALPPGQINLNSGASKLTFNSSNTFVLNNPLVGSGSLSLLGYATVVISNANPSFSGNVTTGNGTPTPGGYINLFNSQGLGNASQITLTHASLLLNGGLDIPSGISFLISGGTSSQSIDIAHNLIPIRSISGDNIIEGNLTLNSGAGDAVINVDGGTLTLNGTFITANTTTRNLVLGGAGAGIVNSYMYDNGANAPGLIKQGSGTWTFNQITAYSGNTAIQGGTLKFTLDNPIPNTPSIQIVSNATLDVSATPFTLGGSQTLGGNGGVLGDVTAYGTVAPAGTLNFSNTLTLAGAAILKLNRTNAQNADLITASSLTFGGTLTITNVGPDLQAGDTFHLFSVPVSGSFSETNLPSFATTNLYWDISQFGSLGIVSVGSTTLTPPTIQPPTVSGGNLQLQITGTQTGHDYVLQATPQLSPANWTDVETQPGGGTLTFTVPINATNPQQFYRISAQ